MTYFLVFLGSLILSPFQELPEKGVPLLKNFTPAEYNYKGKIWSVDSAPNGIVYMASDKGLIEYDGESWNSFIGSNGITRSVLVTNDSLIYTGSDLDFGVWKRNAYQDFIYESLYPFKEDLNEINEEFWDIHSIGDNILFISSSNIYLYKNENLTKISAPNNIENSFIVDDTLYFVDQEEGLYELKDLAPKFVFHFKEYSEIELVTMYKSADELVLVTKNNGLFSYSSGELQPINNKLSNELKTASVFSFEKITDKYLAFGTILDGLYISDLNGNVLHHINKKKGLQNNTILSVHQSKKGKLWLSMDYGISYLDLSNEFTFFYDYGGDFGTGYSAVLKDEMFYLGTNQGLYRSGWEDLNNRTDLNSFELVPNSEGQVWTLRNMENKIWIGHDRGLFILNGNKIERLGDQKGVWTILSYKDYILTGTYNGISILENTGGTWSYLKQMELILGSCNQVFIEGENTLWVNIPNYGIIRASLNEDLYPENRQIFLTDQFKGDQLSLIEINEKVFVQTDEYIYKYNPITQKFSEEAREETKPVIKDLLVGNTQPVQLNNNFLFYSVYNGFALKDLTIDNSQKDTSYQLVYRGMEAFNNEERMEISNTSEIPYLFNNIRIKSIVANQDNVLYQFRFSDSENWSNWSSNNTFEFIGLVYRSYTLSIRAKVDGVITPTETVSFRILAPWYQTIYAYVFYSLVFLLLVYLFYKWRQVSMKKLKKDLLINKQNSLREQAEKYQERLKRIEDEKLQAEYEQLKTQLKNKTIKLATKAKENEEISKVLQTLKEKFEKLEQNPDSLKTRSNEIQKIIDSHLSADDHTFEIQMDQLHQEFFEKLRNDFPELTSYDLRLCAYLKLGFNSKEIANMLNIMPSSVYISRSRLRKKLDLNFDKDLHGYLNSI